MSDTTDRLDVIDACTRMAWCIDTGEWAGLDHVFADEILLDYTSLNGGEAGPIGRDDLKKAWSSLLGSFETTQHLLSNFLVDLGDGTGTAVVTAMFQATHRLPNAHGGPLWTLGGRYRFRLRRTEDGWRIDEVVMTATWADGNQHVFTLAANA